MQAQQRFVGVAATVTALAALSAGAAAQEAGEPGKLYAGVGLAMTNFDGRHEGIGYGDTPFGLQVYGGLQARELMGVELAVERLGGIESGDLLGSGVDRLRISTDYTSFTVRGVFSLPLGTVLRRRQKLALFGSLGLASLLEQRDVLELNTLESTSVSERDTGFVIGAGVTFEVKGVRLRASLQSVDRNGGSMSLLGAAAEFRF